MRNIIKQLFCMHKEYTYKHVNNDGDFSLILTCCNCNKIVYFNLKR